MEIFYRKYTPPVADVKASVVVVHGLGEHSGRYTNLFDVLLAANYAVFAADHQGFGQSGGQRGHVAHFADYLPDVQHMVEMARAERPHTPVIIFGHSMGGLIALYHALEYPKVVDAYVISAPALLASPNPWLVRAMRVLNLVRPTFVIRRPGDNTTISRDLEEVRRFDEDPLHVPVSSARWAVEILKTQKLVSHRAAEIGVPILMVQGMADQLVVPQATVDFFEHVSSADKTLYTYPGYYHELHNDLDKEKPLADVVQWLDERVRGHRR
ncbi:MAG: alpha/beta hydrolase [Caldilineaceae bacterium]